MGQRQTARLYQAAKGIWKLTINERKRILLDHLYGVDLDRQAVEVTKLNLLLKAWRGERADPRRPAAALLRAGAPQP